VSKGGPDEEVSIVDDKNENEKEDQKQERRVCVCALLAKGLLERVTGNPAAGLQVPSLSSPTGLRQEMNLLALYFVFRCLPSALIFPQVRVSLSPHIKLQVTSRIGSQKE